MNGDAVEMVPNPSVKESSNGFGWEKSGTTTVVAETDQDDILEENIDEHNAATKSTRDDHEDMRRMGRNQELVRHFRLLSVASFVAIATAAWEIGLFEITPGLVDGGPVVVLVRGEPGTP